MDYNELLDYVRLRLQDRKILTVAKNTGLHANTVYFIANGRTAEPNAKTLEKLKSYLDGETVQ